MAPAVDHAFFAPGNRAQARRAINLPEEPQILLFVGRIQALKGLDVAIAAFAQLRDRRRAAGCRRRAERSRRRSRARPRREARRRPRRCRPDHLARAAAARVALDVLPRARTSCWCRAARSRSASSRSKRRRAARRSWPPRSADCARSLITAAPASSSKDATPTVFAAFAGEMLGNEPLADRDGRERGAATAMRYQWSVSAARLRRLYSDLTARTLTTCQ